MFRRRRCAAGPVLQPRFVIFVVHFPILWCGKRILRPGLGGLDGLLARVAGRFFRPEPRWRARAYVRGLLAPLADKNGWTLAEVAWDATPDGMQRLLNAANWDVDGVRDDLRGYVVEHLGEPGPRERHRHRVPRAGGPAARAARGAHLMCGPGVPVEGYAHVATVPGLVILVVALAFNLVGDGIRDALDPHKQTA